MNTVSDASGTWAVPTLTAHPSAVVDRTRSPFIPVTSQLTV
jgi:hypothetical protein